MEKIHINGKQLFSLLVLFELGTAIVVPLGLSAKQGSWLTILLGLVGGVGLILLYSYLSCLFPGLTLTSYSKKVFGKYVGSLISFAYIVFFIYGAARDLRDSGEFLQTAMYDVTPIFALNALMILTIMYVLYKGLEVLARTGEIYVVIMFLLLGIGCLLILFSGNIELHNLQPLLGKGWNPIITTAYPKMLMFPFGEAICFTMILSNLNKPEIGIKTGIVAIVISGITLCLISALEVSVLGSDIASRSTFPLLTTISKVSIAEFLQRVDIIVVLALITGGFFKTAIFFYAAVIGATDLFKMKKHQNLVVPIGIIILLSSMSIASNFIQHLILGDVALKTIFIVFSFLIPIILLLAELIRKKLSKDQSTLIPN
ncbi:GerAB/ArcD/ProY family transporter [Bacillus sp. RG28]|uniref:GerAB/ArcD/ProY family transporter n=1 Tax=Gottfriedia endophytica TaxID=2820819 RepID=A0A940NDP1_9BACI|nr:GerAB/ArcD/ProY family transporter [Gottfriedia endophytica]MBP0723609.1 GerAB/ArcD/ProY family transporter [Gottfriedia endophytica]